MNSRDNEIIKKTMAILAEEKDDENIKETLAMLAGYQASFWLPSGIVRKVLLFSFFAIGIVGTISFNWWFLIFVAISCCFSPRIIGESLLFIGKIKKS